MKLAFTIFKYFPYGGLQRDLLRLAKFCAAQGHEVYIFTMAWEGDVPETLHVHILEKKGGSNNQRAINFAAQLKEKLIGFDRVIGFDKMPGLDIYFAGDLCFAYTNAKKHGAWYRLTKRYRQFIKLEASVFSQDGNTKILVLTDEVKRTYQSFYQTSDERFILIPPGIVKQNLNFVTLQKNKLDLKNKLNLTGKLNLLQVGSNFKLKGVDRTIKALASLPDSLRHETHLWIIGRGKEKSFQTVAKKLGLGSQIHFLGTKDNVLEYMQAADLLLHPALFETAGMVLVEALSVGLPIVVTENCGYSFHIAKAGAGKLIDSPFNQKQFNTALAQMLNSHSLETYSKAALDYAQQADLYSFDNVCLDLITTC